MSFHGLQAWGALMQDILAHLEKLRADIAQCEQLERSATSQTKRNIFHRVRAHYKVLAAELERALGRDAGQRG